MGQRTVPTATAPSLFRYLDTAARCAPYRAFPIAGATRPQPIPDSARFAAYPLALTALAALIFRDPQRRTPNEHASLFAPADGTLAAIDELYEHRFLHTDAVRLVINVAPFDVPVQRSPDAGTVRYVELVEGEARPVWEMRDMERNQRLYIGIETDWGPLLMVMYAGPLTPQLTCYVEEGETIAAGGRLATGRFGTRVDLILPADVVGALPGVGKVLRAGVSRMGLVGG